MASVLKNKKNIASVQKPVALSLPKFRMFLKQPWITEKSLNFKSQNKYVFLVDDKANKSIVRQAVQKKYNVKVVMVNIVRKPSKTKHFRQHITKPLAMKKAIVTLAPGQSIELV